ncbi:MAG: hypothetical protein LBL83_09180 [Clostridiales bacterium]|jgi:predicted amidophosphoribosyltransferase|nr:hypothetical protein [Clostridiales bacterium]
MSGAIMSFLFPPKCVFCGRPMGAGAELAVCGGCEGRIPFSGGVWLFESGARGNPGGCDEAIGALAYKGVARSALSRYKFAQRPEYGRTFAALLCAKISRAAAERAAALGEAGNPRAAGAPGASGAPGMAWAPAGPRAPSSHGWADGAAALGEAGAARPADLPGARFDAAGGLFDIVACVPLSRARARERGYNQAEVMARHVAEYFGRPFAGRLLRRRPEALRQSGLQRRERLPNARSAFAADMAEAEKAGLGGKRVLLVDDIATTLSTLHACARELKAAGAARVIGAVAASR